MAEKGDIVYVIWGLSYSTDDDKIIHIYGDKDMAHYMCNILNKYNKDATKYREYKSYEVHDWIVS